MNNHEAYRLNEDKDFCQPGERPLSVIDLIII